MSYTGKVKNGVVIFPPEVRLPEGAEVKVEVLDLLPEDEPPIADVLILAKPRPYWPRDYTLNHAHYSKGHPKKK